jgi:hypothetical protein
MVSAMDRLVRLAAFRISPSRSAGIASGYVSDFMEESYILGANFQALAPALHNTLAAPSQNNKKMRNTVAWSLALASQSSHGSSLDG